MFRRSLFRAIRYGLGVALVMAAAGPADAAPGFSPAELGPAPRRPGPVQSWSLGQVMRAVEGNHPKIRAERARRGVIEADVLTARWSMPNPMLMTDNGTAECTYRVGVIQRLEIGGQRRRRVALAVTQHAVLEADLRVLAASLRAEARRTYMDAFFAQEREKMLIDLIRSIDELLSIADDRPGDIPKSDVLEVRIIRLKARQALETSKFEHLQADVRLNNMLGNEAAVELVLTSPARDRPPRWLDLKNDDWRNEFLGAYEALLAQAFQHRPELARLIRERDILHQEERLRRSERAPDLLFSVGPDFVPAPDYSFINPGVFAMLAFDVPLFNRQQGPIASVKARRAQVNLEGDAVRTDIARQVADAVAFACFQQSQLRLYERELVPAADAVYNDALGAFMANQTPFLVVVRAQESRVLTRLEYLRALAAYHTGLASVEQALGTPPV
jgi:cobalt-zinc-cadmium efflux system outer membrane protein